MKVRLTVTHREKPRLGWACWDAGWLIVEAFYAGLSLARGNWLQLGISGVFTVLFLALMLWHVRATTWDEYSVSRWIDDDAIDS